MDNAINQARQHLAAELQEKQAQVQQAQASLQQAQSDMERSKERLAKFDELLGDDQRPAVPVPAASQTRRKPGPKPGVAKATPKRNVTRAAAAPKKAARKAAKATAKAAAKATPARKQAAPKKKAEAKTKTGGQIIRNVRGKKAGNKRAVEGRRAVARGDRPSIKDAIIQVVGNDTFNSLDVYERLKAKNWLPNANDPRQYISFVLSSTKTKDGKPVFERVQGKGRGHYRVATTKVAKAAPETKDETDQTLTEAGIIPAAAAN